jgi:hypothetical protein
MRLVPGQHRRGEKRRLGPERVPRPGRARADAIERPRVRLAEPGEHARALELDRGPRALAALLQPECERDGLVEARTAKQADGVRDGRRLGLGREPEPAGGPDDSRGRRIVPHRVAQRAVLAARVRAGRGRVAAHQSVGGARRAVDQSIARDGLRRVLRAARCEAAARVPQVGQVALVDPDRAGRRVIGC